MTHGVWLQTSSIAMDFNLIVELRNMVIRGHSYLKSVWKQKVWDRAGSLEDTYWRIQKLVHKNLLE